MKFNDIKLLIGYLENVSYCDDGDIKDSEKLLEVFIFLC